MNEKIITLEHLKNVKEYIKCKLGGYATSESVSEGLSGKVDIVEGMGLSSNDFTDAEKTKLAGLGNYDDTGIKADIASLQENKADKSDTLTSLINLGLSNGNGSRGIVSIPADSAPCEIGQFLDFHRASTSEDYTVRLEALENGDIGMAHKSGIPGGTIHCDVDTVGGYTAEQLIQSNPNLLLNPDFKINQRGKNAAGIREYIADRWLSPSGGASRTDEGFILLTPTVNNQQTLQQIFEIPITGIYTLSAKFKNRNGTNHIVIANNDVIIDSDDFVYTFSDESTNNFYLWANPESTITVEHFKLEKGTVATPFIPPNPLEEALRCGPIENETQQVLYGDGKWANVPSNPNLLDNPDFRINQRGQTEYSSTAEIYACDRWKITGKVRPLKNGGIEWDHWVTDADAGEQYYCDIIQIRPLDEIWESGKTVTLSAYINGQVYSVTGKGAFSKTFYIDGHQIELIAWDGPSYRLRTYGSEDYTITVSWMKLELGSVVTPFVPPNPTTELLKCQRYFQRYGMVAYGVFWGGLKRSNAADISIPTVENMRITPTASFSNISDIYVWDGTDSAHISDISLYAYTGNSATLRLIMVETESSNKPAMLVCGENNAYLDLSADL